MKDLGYYLNLPYTVLIRRDDEGDFVARVDELPGCSAHGSTKQEAIENLEEAQRLWIEDSLEKGDLIPEPTSEGEMPSGKWVQRVPRSLHRKLSVLAMKERVSLNQLVTSILSEAVGIKKPDEAVRYLHEHTLSALNVWFGSFLAEEESSTDWTIHQPGIHYGDLATVARALRLMGSHIPNNKTWNLEATRYVEKKESKYHQVKP